jgi:aspartokinase
MKKNPLNDLHQFLQQEASSIVAPASLSDKLKQEATSEKSTVNLASSEDHLLTLAKQNPQQFYNTLISIGEQMDATKNTMLINTALYLKSGDNWKEAVKKYWSK